MSGYSVEELVYMDDNQVSVGPPQLTGFLAEIFSKFEDEVTDWIYLEKNCCFIVSPDGRDLEAQHIPRENLLPHLILLPPDFFKRYDKNPKGTAMLVLHEVAHGYLNHRGMVTPEISKQQEREAWELAAKWYRYSDYSVRTK